MGARKDYINSMSFGNGRAEEICVLSWGASEALRGSYTQHSIEAGGVAAWAFWASRHSCTPLGQHQEPTPEKQMGQTGRRASPGPQDGALESFPTGD